MTDWLTRLTEGWTYGLPLPLQILIGIIPVLAVVYVVFRFFGIKVAAQVGAALLAAITFLAMLQGAKREGYAVRKREDEEETDKFLKEHKDTADASERLSPADLDQRNRRWVRDE